MKKYLIWLCIVLGIVLLTACSNNKSSTSNGEEITTITYFHPGANQPGLREVIDSTLQNFEDENPDIKVELRTVGWEDAYQKLVTDFNGGQAADVISAGTRWLPAFASLGGIMPLDEYGEQIIQKYHDPLQENVHYDNKLYGIPRAFSTQTLIYRSDLIEEPPTTWEELVEVAKNVQNENPELFGLGIAGENNVATVYQYISYLAQNGGDVFDEEGNAVLNSQEAVEALEFYRGLFLEHEVVPNPLEYNREELPGLFREGKIAMYVSGPWAKVMMGIEPDNSETPYATAVLPKGKEMGTSLASETLMIASDTDNPEEAWRLIEYMSQTEVQKNYDLNQGLVPIQKASLDAPEFTEDPYFSTFVDSIEYGYPEPKPLAWEPFQSILNEAIQKAFRGDDVQTVLDEAVQKIKEEQLEPKK